MLRCEGGRQRQRIEAESKEVKNEYSLKWTLKELQKSFAISYYFITFVSKYDESDFFPKRRVWIDRNRHIHT